MTNIEKYNTIFEKVFSVTEAELNEEFSILNVDKWDSVAHMELISKLEDDFEIMFDTDDIISFSSYPVGISILKKMGVDI